MGRSAGSAQQKKIRMDEEQKARRERRLREMMAESEAECDNPFVRVVGSRQRADPEDNAAGQPRPQQRFVGVQDASTTGPVPPRSRVDLTLRQRPQIEPRVQLECRRPTMESADEPHNPPTQRAEGAKTVVARTTSVAVRSHRTGTSENYLRRLLERVRSWEDARDQARGGLALISTFAVSRNIFTT